MRRHICAVIFLCLFATQGNADTEAVDLLLRSYTQHHGKPDKGPGSTDVATVFSADRGKMAWYRDQSEDQQGRSCTSCHGQDLTTFGRHQKTGKVIEPMARSTNPKRLTEVKKIRKWLLRNCKWTYGRECTPQEKGDFLVWLINQ